jgi:AcrR family transcriptional regulator
LNVFNTQIGRKHSIETRAQILDAALALFRERGLEAATMRDIAKQAGVALGAAYYYFPSKEAIVQEYYDAVGDEHCERVQAAFQSGDLDLEARLRAVFHLKLEILRGDRRLLGALFRYTGEPEHPLSAFGQATRANRQKSIELFRLALAGEKLPEDLAEALPPTLWALHMLMLLYFLYDNSAEQSRTHRLVDSAVSLFVRLLTLARLPLLKPFRGDLLSLLRDAGLFSEPTSRAHVVTQEEPS